MSKGKILLLATVLVIIGMSFHAYKSGYLSSFFNKEKGTTTQLNKNKMYQSYDQTFILEIPSDFSTNILVQTDEITKAEYETTVFSGKTDNEGFQIAISNYTESSSPTIAGIKEDNPSITIEDARDIEIAGAPGVTFLDVELKENPLRNIWFVHGGQLYQITTYEQFDERMADIMSTWQWND